MRKLAALAALLLPALLFAEGSKEQIFTIYYTSSLNGNLDGCTCKSNPKAGLVKRAPMLRSRPRGDSLLVDAGDILDVSPDAELTRSILEVYRELGYDAIGVGDQELSDGLQALRQAAAQYPLISNNLTLKGGSAETPITPSPLAIRKGRLVVNVISLIDPDVFALYPKQIKAQISVTAPATALPQLLAQIKPATEPVRASLTLLLYHGSAEAAAALVTPLEGIDVVIVGHEQRLVHPVKVGNAILASSGEEGNRVGMLELKLRSGSLVGYSNEFRLFDYVRDPDDSSVRKRIEQYREAMRAKTKS